MFDASFLLGLVIFNLVQDVINDKTVFQNINNSINKIIFHPLQIKAKNNSDNFLIHININRSFEIILKLAITIKIQLRKNDKIKIKN